MESGNEDDEEYAEEEEEEKEEIVERNEEDQTISKEVKEEKTAEMVAANVERLANGYSQAYSDFETDSSRALRRELVERKIL